MVYRLWSSHAPGQESVWWWGIAPDLDTEALGDDVCGWSEWSEMVYRLCLATRKDKECLVVGHCAGSSIDTEIDESGSDVCGCTYEHQRLKMGLAVQLKRPIAG